MKLWHAARKWTLSALAILLGMGGIGIAGCRPITGTPTPPAPAMPLPVEIRYIDTDRQAVLTPQDNVFAEAVADLQPLLGSIEAQARTLFSSERLDAEVAPTRHVYIRYDEELEFTGQAITWRAIELIAAVVSAEPMLLARGANSNEWSVYLPANPEAVDRFIEAIDAHLSH